MKVENVLISSHNLYGKCGGERKTSSVGLTESAVNHTEAPPPEIRDNESGSVWEAPWSSMIKHATIAVQHLFYDNQIRTTN